MYQNKLNAINITLKRGKKLQHRARLKMIRSFITDICGNHFVNVSSCIENIEKYFLNKGLEKMKTHDASIKQCNTDKVFRNKTYSKCSLGNNPQIYLRNTNFLFF